MQCGMALLLCAPALGAAARALAPQNCSRNDHQCGGLGFNGPPCCIDPDYSCRVQQTIGAEHDDFMRCVRGADKPSPSPPDPPPTPPAPPPRPQGPPPDPPFVPFEFNGIGSADHHTQNHGMAFLVLAGFAVLLVGLAQYSGVVQHFIRVKRSRGMQRISTCGDDDHGLPVGKRRHKDKRRPKIQHQAVPDTMDDDDDIVPRCDTPKSLNVGSEAPDADSEETPTNARCVLVLEMQHKAGLLAMAKKVLQTTPECQLFSVSAITMVRDGDVWVRMTCDVSISSRPDRIRSILMERLKDELNSDAGTCKMLLTIERQQERQS